MLVKISEIRVGDRIREDDGDINPLADNISEVGLLEPLLLAPVLKGDADGSKYKYYLVCGQRRLLAEKKRGSEFIEAEIKNLSKFDRIRAEIAENQFRKDFTFNEIIKAHKILGPIIEEEARLRQKRGKANQPGGNFPQGTGTGTDTGKRRDIEASLFNMSGKNFDKILKVNEAVITHPSFKPIWDKANRSGKIDKAYNTVKRELKIEEGEKLALAAQSTNNKNKPWFELIHGDMCEILLKGKRFKNYFNAIFTDPPYGEEFWYLADELARASLQVLTPGSSLFVIAPDTERGYEYYFDTIRKLGMRFNGYIALVHNGPQKARLHQQGLRVYHKPLLHFFKPDAQGKFTKYRDIDNTIFSEEPDKGIHEWRQDKKEVKHVLGAVTVKRNRVLDPLVGSGTTAEGCYDLSLYFTGIELAYETYNKTNTVLSSLNAWE